MGGMTANVLGWLKGITPGSRSLLDASARRIVTEVEGLSAEMAGLSDAALRRTARSLSYRAKAGEPIESLMVESFAATREAGRRANGMRHYDVQLLAGVALVRGAIVEMQTGEGKTLVATLPLALYALCGKGAHLATVNDYLAKRDAEWMEPIYSVLGMSVGIVQSQMGFDERDEIDSILIDEARTPLIISSPPGEAQATEESLFRFAAGAAALLDIDEDFEVDVQKQSCELLGPGRSRVRALERPALLESLSLLALYDAVERALRARRFFNRDRQYVVRDGKIVIIDEFTGRAAEGRTWRDGLHQAVEAKEGIEVTVPSGHAARITIQDLFARWPHLAGMTGTIATSAGEIGRTYDVGVAAVPTNRPAIRERLPAVVCGAQEEKFARIVAETVAVHATGRPVLIGTRSIDKSEELSRLLTEVGLTHTVLNARQIEREAEIVAQAGQPGQITVSTNMAGRGTDIRLGDGVYDMGGLHVICTELHDSARIDRQLVGRCGRQGDPGTWRQYVSLDDDILVAGYGPDRARRVVARLRAGLAGDPERLLAAFTKAQRLVEQRHVRQRRVLEYVERQRAEAHIQMSQDPYLDSAS